MVEGTGLENQQAGNRLGGSNPSPSAINKMQKKIEEIVKELCSPKGEFPTKDINFNGYDYTVFDWGPKTLYEYFKLYENHTNKDMIVYEDERWTFEESYNLSSAFANALIEEFKISKGDRVAIASRNFPEWIFSFIAITSIGGIVVPMNSWWTSTELEYGLKNCNAKLVIADAERLERINAFKEKLSFETITIRSDTNLENDWDKISQKYINRKMPIIDCNQNDDATIFYTSGSTGHPKGVCSSHRSIISALLQWMVVATARNIKDDIVNDDTTQPSCLLTVPLFHVTGSHAQFMLSFLSGRKMVIMYKWSSEEALKLIEKEKITTLNGVPTMTLEVMRDKNRNNYDISSLKELSGGGAARPSTHVEELKSQFPNASPGLGYGLTETNAAGAVISGEDYLKRPGSTGKPTPPLTSIKIMDQDNIECKINSVGEIWIKSITNFRCYWKKDEETKEAYYDEWFKSGDLGYLDQDNFLFIVDRAKDIVIRGGENISCLEVEDIINRHNDVLEASVYGIPDERLGEKLCCSLSLKENANFDEKLFKKYLKKYLASFKIPEYFDIHSDKLPRTASGKIYKLELRDELKKKLKIIS